MENIAAAISIPARKKSGISMANCEEWVSPSLNSFWVVVERMMGLGLLVWSDTHIKLKQITGGVLGLTLK